MQFSEPAATSGSLSQEIAVRSRSLDYYAIGSMYLPNPDPVLKAQGRDIDVYNDLLIDDRVGGGMIIPDDGGVEFKESGSKGATSDLYRGIIAEANSAISTVWLGHAAAGESVPGKLGGDAAATDVRDDLRDSDKTLVEAFFNTVIDYLAEINWGSASGAPRFSLWEEEDVDKDQAERDVNLTSALEKSGLKLSRSYYIRTYNLEEGDVEDKPAQPAPAPPAQFSEQPAGDPSVLLADKLGQNAMAATDPWIQQLRRLTMAAASLEDLRDGIIELYGQMDPAELGGIIARAMTLADCAGRSDVMDGN